MSPVPAGLPLPAPPPDLTVRWRQVRLVAGAIVGLASGFAGLFIGSLSLFVKPIAQDFGWNRADISAAIIMSMLGLAIGSPIQGRLMDRIGARRVIAAATAAMAVAILLLSVLPADRLLFAATCLAIGLLGTATGPNGYLSLLPAWFDRRLGLALACAMIGVGVGGSVLTPLVAALIREDGWRYAYRILAAISLTGGAAALVLVAVGAPPRSIGTSHTDATGLSFGEGLRDWRMLVLGLALALGGACGLGITFHVAAMLDDRGFAPGQIATTVALGGIGLAAGRLIGGPLLDELPARFVGAAAYLIGAVAVAILALDLTRSFPVVAAGGFCLGLSLGTEGDLAAFTIRRYFGTRAFAGLYGCLFMTYSLGSVVGVILCGRSFDLYGSYFVAGSACVGGFLLAALLVLRLDRYRFARADAPAIPGIN